MGIITDHQAVEPVLAFHIGDMKSSAGGGDKERVCKDRVLRVVSFNMLGFGVQRILAALVVFVCLFWVPCHSQTYMSILHLLSRWLPGIGN